MSIAATYQRRTTQSAERGTRAERVLPGGETRSAGWHEPYPLTIDRGDGPFVWDVDGNCYIDLAANYTSLVHGHAYPPIVDALAEWSTRGTAWPARNDNQVDLASQLVDRVASVDLVRFTNSGTEANMLACQVARKATGRRGVLMARHGYHGSHELFEAGTFGHDHPDLHLADFGDADSFAAILEERGPEIASVFLEPVMGAAGIIPAPPGFLAGVATAARDAGALFVLDEVITFRLSTGGAQRLADVTPDLTTFAKIIGGGLPVGAFGGRADLMALTDPRRNGIYHTGTFNGNPLTMAAGSVAVRELTAERITAMNARLDRLASGLVAAAGRLGVPFSVTRAGSMLNVHFDDAPPTRPGLDDTRASALFHLAGLNHGLFFPPRGLFVLSTVFGDVLVDEVIERATLALADVASEL